MSKKKRSKILATLLCATTMAAFYVSPQIGYAVDLYYKTDGSGEVVINGGGTNTKIEDLSGIASITFGTPGEQGEGGVRFFLDAQEFGGVRAEGAFTANDLYIMVDPKGEGTERYSLRNVMGIYRNQDQITGEYATSIESGISGGGMQITNDTINMLDGTIAISTENNAKYNISFDGKFNSEQGMTVGTDYTLDNRGNITTTGSISAKGTINGNEITENTFNEVTLDGGEVTADEVIADGYKLTEVGSTLKTIDDKTKGIISYTSENGTTFQGKITAYSGIVTSDVQTNTLNTTNIVSGNDSFTVHEAKEAIDWVDEWDSKVRDYDGRITQNETDIATLEKTVGDENSGLVKDVNDLQTATTGMTYNQSTGTTFSQAVTANDFKIADGTSLSQVASELTTAQGDIQTNANNITTLTGKVTIAEGEIGTLQTATTGMNYNSGTGTTFKQVVNATDFKVGDVTLTGVAGDLDTAEGKIIKNETAISGLGTRVTTAESEIGTLKSTTADHESRITANTNNITTLTGKVTTAEDEIDTLQTTVGEHDTDIKDLETKTHNISNDGNSITNLTNLTATTGTIGSVTFNGGTATGLNTIGTAADTVTVAGTAISNGSFNGVTISNYNSSGSTGATINGISIYKDTNSDYIVGDVNISALKGVSGTEIEGIERTDNTPDAADDNNFTTTIEGTLKVNTDGTFSNANESFKVDVDGNVTGKDFVINGVTSLSTVAQATTGMTYTAGNTTAEGVTSFDHNVHATNFTTDSADLNKLSATVGDDTSGLVKDVKTLESKTQGFSDDGKNLNLEGSIKANTGTIGNISFSNYAIGTDSDTITVAGTPISKGSFNGVGIKYENSNYWVGDVNLSELKANAGTVRGITYTNGTNGNYTMNFAEGAFSVSTTGEFTFNYNGKQYGLDKLINTVDTGDLEDFQELKDKVKNLEDKTTGISFDKDTGSTTISDMTGTDTDGDGINDSFTKGDNSLTVGDDGITANGDTVINGDTDDNTTGGNGNGSSDPQGGDSIINGDQLVNGDQHVTGDSQFDGTVTVGTGTDGKGQTVIDGGTINTGNTVIDGGQVKADEGHFGNITVGEDDNQTTIG